MTVRQAFCLAFGEVPDGATCHIGYVSRSGYRSIAPTLAIGDAICFGYLDHWVRMDAADNPFGNDISDLPAETFVTIGVFGDRYDNAVRGEL